MEGLLSNAQKFGIGKLAVLGLIGAGLVAALAAVVINLSQPPMTLLFGDLDPKTAAFVLELTDKIVSETKLTTMMVTHSMRQALDHGQRTVMLHQGEVVLDVAGQERAGMDVKDLLRAFERTRGEEIDDDQLLLA